jgi:23S rRNA (uracil1939-C5)-methyltransferase
MRALWCLRWLKWQNMKYSQQLYYKQNETKTICNIGKVELPDFEPILGSEKQFFYRNKMEFSFQTAAG